MRPPRLRRRELLEAVVALAVAVLVAAAAMAATATPGGEPLPRCAGAEAREPRGCVPFTGLAVRPTPAQARAAPNARCSMVSSRTPKVCAFGVAAEAARHTVVLVGDSHAGHWRGALDVVARVRRWRGLSLTRHGCYLSAATKAVPEPSYSQCLAWKRELRRWFARRPEIATVFVSHIVGGSRIPGADDQFEAAVRGFADAWRTLPRTVRRVVVLRDTPRATAATSACLEAAIAARRHAGTACAVPRAEALRTDPAVVAARRLGAGRVRVVDLSETMCDPAACLPVVGGVLVWKDSHHLTVAFARTLGPVLDRALRRALP